MLFRSGRRISNSIQTNGTLLNDEWCRFLRENNWLVGISIDGPQEFHDEFRRTASGAHTWQKVMHGIRLLKKHGVEWNAMAVVNDFNADYPRDFYRFFKENGCQFLQFTPIVERIVKHADGRHLATITDPADAPLSDMSVTPEQWGRFLCAIFDEWVRHDVGKIYVELFDCMLANWVGVTPGICMYAKECGHAGVMEFNGDVYSCDHYAFAKYRLGNLLETSLSEIIERNRPFCMHKTEGLPDDCFDCAYITLCFGGCPKNRILLSEDGQRGKNYLCEGYKKFFSHFIENMPQV